MKKILIIGGNGYIGSALNKNITNDYDVSIIDMCWFNTPLSSKILLLDYKNITKEYLMDFDVVILLAGHSSVKMCEGNLIHSFNNNVRNFINLVENLNEKTKFIYASSSSVYGKCTNIADENYDNFIPYNNYDITKHVIDLCVQRYNIEYYGLRFGTVNGYSPIVRKDVMINSMYSNATNNGEIKLYIKNIMRPILGINDLISAIKVIINSETDLRGIYNLASFNKTAEEIAYSVGNVINVPVKEYDVNPNEIITNPKVQTVCYDFKIDCSKFERTFNFKFNETIESIVESLKKKNYIETTRYKPLDYE